MDYFEMAEQARREQRVGYFDVLRELVGGCFWLLFLVAFLMLLAEAAGWLAPGVTHG